MALLLRAGGRLRLRGGGVLLLQTQPASNHPKAPAARSVAAGYGLTTLTWTRPLDPHETIFYTIDWSEELGETSDSIASDGSFWILSGSAIAAGLMIAGDAHSYDSQSATVWLTIDQSRKNDVAWIAGETHVLTHRVVTTGGQTLERVINLGIKSFQN